MMTPQGMGNCPRLQSRTGGSHSCAAGQGTALTCRDVVQPDHVETVVARIDSEGSLLMVKLSRHHDNQQFWTGPGVRDQRLRGRKTAVTTEPEADQ